MPTADDIRLAKESQTTTTETATTYNPGHLGGFDITFDSEQPYIGPGAVDVKGKKVLRRQKIALADCTWRIPKINSYQYYLYIDLNGTIYVDNQVPVTKDSYVGLYHPLLLARNLGRVYVNDVGRYIDYTVATFVLVGYSGEGTPYAPAEGDRRQYIDGDEDNYEEYTGGEWTAVNGIRIGGTDSNGVFISGLACRQVVNPLAAEISQEFVPAGSAVVLNYEGNTEDQDGVSADAEANVVYTTTWSKFGTKSLSASSMTRSSVQRLDTGFDTQEPLGMSKYIYVESVGTTSETVLMETSEVDTSSRFNRVQFILTYSAGDYKLGVKYVDGIASTETYLTSAIMDSSTILGEHYIAGGISPGVLWLVVDGLSYETTWTRTAFTQFSSAIGDKSETNFLGSTYYSDEWAFMTGEDVSPDIFIQHYTHNVAWNTDYSAKDVIIKPAEGGYIQLDGPTDYYAPVSGEESLGTLIVLTDQSTANPYHLVGDSSVSTAWEAIDVSALVPSNAKGVMVSVFSQSKAAAAGQAYTYFMLCHRNDLTGYYKRNSTLFSQIYAPTANYYCSGSSMMHVKLNDSKIFYYCQGAGANISTSAIYISLIGYYI